jgi:copper chaperone CopZ
MKHPILFTLLFISTVLFAKNITSRIEVKANCKICKEKIEKTLDIPGISHADWNKETKILTVRYNDKKVSLDDIHSMISKIGYSTNKVNANTKSQAQLMKCCQPKEPIKKCGTTKKGCCSK